MPNNNSKPEKSQQSKKEVLKFLQENREDFSKEEVLEALEEDSEKKEDEKERGQSLKSKLISGVAYAIGASIVILGVGLLGWEYWGQLSSIMRILVTFGLGVIVYGLAVWLETASKIPKMLKASVSMLSAFLMVFGGGVIASEIYSLDFIPKVQVIITAALAVLFGVLFVLRKSSFYFIFVYIFFSWFSYAFVSMESIQTQLAVMEHPVAIYYYLTFLIGVVYLVSHYLLSKRINLSDRFKFFTFLAGVATTAPFLSLTMTYNATGFLLIGTIIAFVLTRLAYKVRKDKAVLGAGAALIFGSFGVGAGLYFTTPLGMLFGFLIFLFLIPMLVSLFKDYNLLPYALVAILSGTLFYFSVFGLEFIQKTLVPLEHPETIEMLLTSLISITYLHIAYLFSRRYNLFDRFSKSLSVVGSFGVITPLFSIGYIYSGGVWDLIAILGIISLIGVGTYLERKTILIPGALLLSIHILIVSRRYFLESVGWAITLIIAGFTLMGVGYISYRLLEKMK